MNSTQLNRNKILLAAALGAVGAGVVIGAAGWFIYSSLDEKKKLNSLQQDLARDSCLLNNSIQSTSSNLKRSRRNSQSSSRSGYETEDDFYTALETDEEFCDLNSEDEDTFMRTVQEDSKKKSEDSEVFEKVDILMKGSDEDSLKAFNLLKKYEFEMSDNPDFLWRYAKAYQIQAVLSGAQKDLKAKEKYVYEGLEYATKALAFDADNPNAHKWFAILTGMQTEFVSIKDKIKNGYLFQKHILIAIESKPEDYSLHHLLGRFKFELANISWIEKKMASSIFAEFPDFTYSDAINDLLKAEDLNPTPWKENRLLLAKCYIGDRKYDKAVEWLDSAKGIAPKKREDAACDQEVNNLLEKYKTYRK